MKHQEGNLIVNLHRKLARVENKGIELSAKVSITSIKKKSQNSLLQVKNNLLFNKSKGNKKMFHSQGLLLLI